MKKSNIIKWNRNDDRKWFDFEEDAERFETGLMFGVFGAMKTGKTTNVKKWLDSFLKPDEILYVVPKESIRPTDNYDKYNVCKLSTSLLSHEEFSKIEKNCFLWDMGQSLSVSNKSLFFEFGSEYDWITKFIKKPKNIKMVVFEELGFFNHLMDDVLMIFRFLLSIGVSITYIMINKYSCIFRDETAIIDFLKERSHYFTDIPYNKCKCGNNLDAEHTEDKNLENTELKTPESFTGRKRYNLYCYQCIINKRTENKKNV